MTKGAKITGLDIARSAAVFAAMLAHSLTTSGALSFLSTEAPVLKLLLRTSTPTFIVLFGVMLELVYFKRLKREGLPSVAQRMLTRAIQCYVLYVLSLLPLLITGKQGVGEFVTTAMLIGTTPYTDILRYYTILFVLSPVLLLVRQRLGVRFVVGVAVAVQLLHPLLANAPKVPTLLGGPYPGRVLTLLFGYGDAIAGPSVIHSLFFVAVGMATARALRLESENKANSTGTSERTYVLIWAVLAFGTAVSILVGPEVITLDAISGMALRNANHPLYFFAGSLGAFTLIVALRRARATSTSTSRASMLGERSLFTFSFGNSFLYLFPRGLDASLATQFAFTAALMAAIIAFSSYYDVLMRQGSLDDPQTDPGRSAMLLRSILGHINNQIAEIATWTVRRVGALFVGWTARSDEAGDTERLS